MIVDPGDEPDKLLGAIEQLGITTVEAILVTHTHFDHIGAVAPVAAATKAPVWCPELENPVLANIMDFVPWPGFGPFESYEADHTIKGGETLDARRNTIDVIFTPGHSPGHVTYAIREEQRAVQRRRPVHGVGRARRPARRRLAHAAEVDRDARRLVPGGHHRIPRPRADHDARPRAGDEPVPAGTRATAVIQAPRGTFDVLPDDAARREALEAQAKRILEAAGYRRIETPTYEATELFARGVGEATDIVQKEMYSFNDGGGRSLTLRPEGTAPVCRAYIEHGMHKQPQPVKLWYLESFYRAEAPQRGRYRQFWQVGAELIGAAGPDADAELILLLADILTAVGVRDRKLLLSSLGQPETRTRYRDELIAYLHQHELAALARGPRPHRAQPDARFRRHRPGTRNVMENAPKLLDRLEPEDREHFDEVKRLLDDAGIEYELDPTLVRGLDYYTRTLFEFPERRARRAVGCRRRRPLRPADRAARRPADARVGMGRRRRADAARGGRDADRPAAD